MIMKLKLGLQQVMATVLRIQNVNSPAGKLSGQIGIGAAALGFAQYIYHQ
jgi:hypothetical protein